MVGGCRGTCPGGHSASVMTVCVRVWISVRVNLCVRVSPCVHVTLCVSV